MSYVLENNRIYRYYKFEEENKPLHCSTLPGSLPVPYVEEQPYPVTGTPDIP
jgi:hypothetical protein